VTVLPGALNIATSHADRAPPCIYRATPPLRNPNVQNSERLHEKDVGPTRGFAASPGVGPGATVDTLKTRYPCVQALSQDERQDRRVCSRVPWLRLPHPGSGELRSCLVPHGPGSRLLDHGSSRAAMCLMAPAPTTRPRGSSGTTKGPLGCSSRLLAQGNSGAALCPVGGLYEMQAIKVNKYPLATRPS
jgi:hypothetical protein